MNNHILYLGDTTLETAASYLAGVMSHYGLEFQYRPSDSTFDSDILDNNCQAIIISDYPAINFTQKQLTQIADKVKVGVGLLMIGGWESFTGLAGGYNKTSLKEVLPVIISNQDDRVNHSGPCLVAKNGDHPILSDLPFTQNAPVVGGFNRFTAKPDTQTLLSTHRYVASYEDGNFTFARQQTSPLLVAGKYGHGRTLAFASDVAPHWIGGMVDWGDQRIIAQAKDAEQIEVGNWYASFFFNMLRWIMGKKI